MLLTLLIPYTVYSLNLYNIISRSADALPSRQRVPGPLSVNWKSHPTWLDGNRNQVRWHLSPATYRLWPSLSLSGFSIQFEEYKYIYTRHSDGTVREKERAELREMGKVSWPVWWELLCAAMFSYSGHATAICLCLSLVSHLILKSISSAYCRTSSLPLVCSQLLLRSPQ